MPKVTEEYMQNKRNTIIDATYRLCLKKTVSTVTMQDIINETGLSQGGIYRFFRDIDEILAGVIDKLRIESHFKERLDETFSEIKQKPLKEVIHCLFSMLGESMEDGLMGIEKLDYELNILAINMPKRMNHILEHTKEVGNKEYLRDKSTEFFKNLLISRTGKLRISPDELIFFITAAYSGIQMTSIVSKCYKESGNAYSCFPGPISQMNVLADSVLYLLGEV